MTFPPHQNLTDADGLHPGKIIYVNDVNYGDFPLTGSLNPATAPTIAGQVLAINLTPTILALYPPLKFAYKKFVSYGAGPYTWQCCQSHLVWNDGTVMTGTATDSGPTNYAAPTPDCVGATIQIGLGTAPASGVTSMLYRAVGPTAGDWVAFTGTSFGPVTGGGSG